MSPNRRPAPDVIHASALPFTLEFTAAPDPTLAFVSTIRHDGQGGVADDLADPAALTTWLATQSFDAGVVDEALWIEVVALRRAIRALFAEAVRPGPLSRADSATLMPVAEAVDHLNRATLPLRPVLSWPPGGPPAMLQVNEPAPPAAVVIATLAQAAMEFLSGPDRERLRACPAPRCVRYFVKESARQEWCKPSCGNRARVARHYRRQQEAAG